LYSLQLSGEDCSENDYNKYVLRMNFPFSFKVCEDLEPPEFGQVNIDGSGTVASYTCNVGYTMDGDRSRDCQLDGTSWTGNAPTCGRLIQCP
jgi:hypothetical protein